MTRVIAAFPPPNTLSGDSLWGRLRVVVMIVVWLLMESERRLAWLAVQVGIGACWRACHSCDFVYIAIYCKNHNRGNQEAKHAEENSKNLPEAAVAPV